MGSYENFARVYDELMDNVPYEEWADFILAILKKNKITDGLVLELGCGTGKLMSLLGNAGFDMIGVDNSVDMLQIAREKTVWYGEGGCIRVRQCKLHYRKRRSDRSFPSGK